MRLREITYEYVESLKYVNEINREFEFGEYPDIFALIGPRRVGKTYLMLKRVKSLLDYGDNVIYAPFDEPELREINVKNFAELVRREYPEGVVHLFLDEVQEWRNWDFNLRWLHDMKEFRIYVSGSSSALLSSEIPSRLRGRYISRILLPLSFRELPNIEVSSFRGRGRILRLLDEYIRYGGFPEIWITRSREKIVNLLETIFYRDIVDRFRIRDLGIFREIFYFIISNYGNIFTWRSLGRILGGLGVKVDTKTLINYIRYMEQAFLIFTVNKFAYSTRKQIVAPKKIYIIDTSFMNIFSKPLDMGRRMENIVFLELLRKKHYSHPLIEINYYITKNNKEVDFIVKTGNKINELIEVTYEEEKIAEKTKVLKRASDELDCKNLIIVTWDVERVIREDDLEIKAIPLWKWLQLK